MTHLNKCYIAGCPGQDPGEQQRLAVWWCLDEVSMDHSPKMEIQIFTLQEALETFENTPDDNADVISDLGWRGYCEECFVEWYMDQTGEGDGYTPEEEGVRWWRKKFK